MGIVAPVIVVTGANGFVGRACVASARKAGLQVQALYRSKACPEWAADAGITAVQADLARALPDLPDHCSVIHCAGHLGDNPDALRRDTLDATALLLEAARGRGIRIVLVSSLAVYDTDLLRPGDRLTEASALLPDTSDLTACRDAYAGAKRLQESLLTQAAQVTDCWILRPGAIWGPTRTWHALQGFWLSRLHVTIGSDGELPLAHVDHVAQACVKAALTPAQGTCILNVFDDDRPTRARFLRAHRRIFGWPRLNITVPFGLWLALARVLRPVAAHLPGLFQEPILRARTMPLAFPNTQLRGVLGGEDLDTFEGMMTRSGDQP